MLNEKVAYIFLPNEVFSKGVFIKIMQVSITKHLIYWILMMQPVLVIQVDVN